MDAKLLDTLRRKELTTRLADGREAVTVTVQYKGEVPPGPRHARRSWLHDRFSLLGHECGERVRMNPESISLSGQTIDATIPVEELDELRSSLSNEFHVDISVPRQIIDPP